MPDRPIIVMLVRKGNPAFDDTTISQNDERFELRWPAPIESKVTADEAQALLAGAQGCVTTWGSPRLDEALLGHAPDLQILAHAAGSVKPYVSDALWDRGIKVTSAAAANAVDVAHYTIGLMIISVKKMLPLASEAMAGRWRGARAAVQPQDFRGATVGIIAASHIGRTVLGLLKHFDVETLLYDPYCSEEAAEDLGARKVSLEELFQRSDIVSVHAPSVADTRHMVNGQRIGMMKKGAVLINTARGSLVDEAALVNACREGRISAYLDVTDPEPPPPGSPLLDCPNLVLTPHIAGSMGRGRRYLGELAFQELQRHFSGEALLFPVTKEMLPTIA